MGDPAFIKALANAVGPEHVLTDPGDLARLSQDFNWYSPVLKEVLESKKAEVVVRAGSMADVRAVLALCWRYRVPLVIRGAGTGNYGQAVPLQGGLVLDLSRFDQIHELRAGLARVSPGVRLGTLEQEARQAGWELRCMPSTWVKSTVAGFLCGGSGGIGSISWGGLAAPDTVESVTIMTCEEEPRCLTLRGSAALNALHSYGTNGVVVEAEVRLAPARNYEQLAVSCDDWDTLLAWTDHVARYTDWGKRLVTQFEAPIPGFFKPLSRYLPADQAASFLLVEQSSAEAVVASANKEGLSVRYRGPLTFPSRGPLLTDYTWNHTTLWAIKADSEYTYIQVGFADDFRRQFAELKARFGNEVLLHLEWVAASRRLQEGHNGHPNPSSITVGGIPLVRYTTQSRLNEIISALQAMGIYVANPHTYVLEDGSFQPNLEEKRSLKGQVDPRGLMNPGKMKSAPAPLA